MSPFMSDPGDQSAESDSPVEVTRSDGSSETSLEDAQDAHPRDKTMPIAIVGMSFRGPADATNVQKLWNMISEKREGWGPIPKEKWNNEAFYHPDNTRHGTINVEGGHFFSEDMALFDAPFFNMSSAEAAALDPQQRLLLEGTFEALESGGIALDQIMGSKTSCFVGSFSGDYTDMLVRDPDSVPMYQCTNAGQSRAITANRVSYFFDLKGPSVTVDTACSGSLVALHLACQSLRTGDAKCAIAAGVNTILSHEFMSTMSMMKFLSPDGRCYTFDERANGYARGEGVGCLILKPLHDALRDNDTIRAVIRGSGSNQDGKTMGITLPSAVSQEALVRDVYAAAGLSPLDTEYVEAHGTGTQAGDPLETGALSKVFAPGRSVSNPLRIGSIKTNIGHLEGASGIAGVIKAVLMLENRVLLPNRNFERLNPRIPLDEWKLKIQLDLEDWKSPGPYRASVNSFGYGGSNAHVILEDTYGYLESRNWIGSTLALPAGLLNSHHHQSSDRTIENQEDKPTQAAKARLFVLSSFDEAAGNQQSEQLRQYILEKGPLATDSFMSDLAYTLNERRTRFGWRSAVVGSSAATLASSLASGKKFSRASKKPTVGFVFTGQGAQWCGMGKELLETYQIFSETIDRIGKHLKSLGSPFDVREECTKDPKDSKINLALYSQPMCTAIQIALVNLLGSWGIKPASVTGHSSGEIAAAYTMGALSEEDAMSVAYYRGVASSNMQEAGEVPGSMMAVGMSEDEIQPIIQSLVSGKAVVACVNSPSSVTVSGDVTAIDELKAILDEQKAFARKLAVEVAYHSHHMNRVADGYLQSMAGIVSKPRPAVSEAESEVEYFSAVTGTQASALDLGPQYWVANMLQQVKFRDSIRAMCFSTTPVGDRGKQRARKTRKRDGAAAKATVDVLVEIGPHSALAGPIKQILRAEEALNAASISYASALVRQKSAVDTVLDLAAYLLVSGLPVNLSSINDSKDSGKCHSQKVLGDLPSYPWNHSKAYWAEPRISKVYRHRKFPRTDLLGVLDRYSNPIEPRWRNHIRATEIPWIRDHKIQSNIVYPAAGYIAMAIEALSQATAENSHGEIKGYLLRDVTIGSALVLDEQDGMEVQLSLKPHHGKSTNLAEQWYEFNIYSVSDENRWTEHARGLIQPSYSTTSTNAVTGDREKQTEAVSFQKKVDNAKRLCTTQVPTEPFYDHLRGLGLEYGETFANMRVAYSSTNTCLAQITVPDTASTMPMGFQYPFFIHPATLDSVLHPIFVALSDEKESLREPAVPVSIEELYISKNLSSIPGDILEVYTTVERPKHGEVAASIWAGNHSHNGTLLPDLSMENLKCRVLSGENDNGAGVEKQSHAYKLDWQLDADLILPHEALKLFSSSNSSDSLSVLSKDLNECALHYISKAISLMKLESGQDMGCQYQKQASHFACVLEKARESSGSSEFLKDDEFLKRVRLSGPEGELVCAIGENLGPILETSQDPLDFIPSKDQLEAYWSDTSHFAGSNRNLAGYLRLLGHQNPHMTILEANAGAGSTALAVLEALTEKDIHMLKSYTCTDADSERLSEATISLSKWPSIVGFKQLDISQDLEAQSFESLTYDVVIIARDAYDQSLSIESVLQNARKLLKDSGRLIISDHSPSHERPSQSLALGFLENWLGSSVSNLPACDESEWNARLVEAGFCGVEHVVHDEDLLGYRHTTITSCPKPSGSDADLNVIIVTDDESSGLATAVEDAIKAPRVHTIRSTFAQAQPRDCICIVLSDLNGSVLEDMNAEAFDSVKKFFTDASGIVWVTKGGTFPSPHPNSSLITGFARTARSELGGVSIVTLDLDAATQSSELTSATAIGSVFRKAFLQADQWQDFEYAEKQGRILIPRLMEASDANESISKTLSSPVPVEQAFFQSGRSLRATFDPSSQDPMVYFADTPKHDELPADHVTIEQRASGITVADSDAVIEKISNTGNLGIQCSGIVRSVGDGVTDLAIGDRVCCLGSGTLRSFYHDKASSFQKIPDEVSFEAAAALPVPYCSAYFAVHHLAKVTRQDTVLIHGAAGPCGQALLEFCKLKGNEIYASVSSVEQKDLLMKKWQLLPSHIFFSKDANLTSGVLQATEQIGVNVIFNLLALSAEALRLTWRCIAPYGHYIDMSGSDATKNNQLGSLAVQDDFSFSTFDISKFIAHRKDLAVQTLANVMCLLRVGAIQGPTSFNILPISDLQSAITEASKLAIEPVVVTATPDTLVKALPLDLSGQLLREDASYLLVGGLGGIGRATAVWMIDHGARNLIFANRSGLARAEARETVQSLEERGAHVAVYECDVADESQVLHMTARATLEMPPIRGVIQGAMVLRDSLIEKLTVEDFQAALYPKLRGCWNLHNFLPKDMDFFVMESSISGVIGNATQSAYAAGSTFMDAFSAYRNSLGLPAVTLDLGVITGIGYLSEQKELAAGMERQGFEGTDETKLMALIHHAITNPRHSSISSQVVTGLGTWKDGKSLSNFDAALFSHFRRASLESSAPGAADEVNGIRDQLKAATSLEDATAVVCTALASKIAGRLQMPEENISSANPITEYGVDSLVAVEIRNWISKELKSTVPILEILANASMVELAGKIAARSELVKVSAEDA